MRQLEITQRSMEELILAALKDDLNNVMMYPSEDRQVKKDIKALKRVINFYSITPPYPDVK